jgi:hypothetical protein
MAANSSENKIVDEIKHGQKPSGEVRAYLRKLSAGRHPQKPNRSSSTKGSISSLRVGPGLVRRRKRKMVQVNLGGNRIVLPCSADRAMAIAMPNLNNGYWLGSDFQVGSPVDSVTYPGGTPIELHTFSSLVRPETGEFSLCAVVNNKAYFKNVTPPYDLYPPEIQFGISQATEAKGTIWQIFNVPSVFEKKPKSLTATAVLSADHVMSSLLAFCFAPGTFAGVYGQADITLYDGIQIFPGPAVPSASQIIDFLALESPGGTNPSSNFSDLDAGGKVTVSVNLPWAGTSEWFIVEVNVIITCLIYKQDKDSEHYAECALADLRLVDDNRTMVFPDLPSDVFDTGQEQTDPSMSCPIVLDMITLCG